VIYASRYLPQTVPPDHVEEGRVNDGGSLGCREYLEDQGRTGGRGGYEHASVVPHIWPSVEAVTWHHGS
jgi:hypothetical protein